MSFAPRASLRRRFVGAIAIAYVATGLAAALALRPVLDAIIGDLGVKFAIQRVSLEKAKLEGLIEREVALSRALADSPVIVAWCQGDQDAAVRARGMAELTAFRRRFRDQTSFVIIDENKKYYFDDAKKKAPEVIYTIDPGKREDGWYPTTMQSVDTYGLNLDRDVILDTTKVWINTIVHDGPRKVGLAGTGLDISDFTRAIVRDSDEEVSVIVTDARGVLQAHRNRQLLERNAKSLAEGTTQATVFELVGNAADRERLAQEFAAIRATGTVSTFTIQIEGKPRLVAAAWIGELKLYDLVLLDPSAVVGGRRFIPLFAVGIGFALALIVAVALLMNRWVLTRLASLMESALEIADGRYGTVLPIDRADEIGALTDSFNRMSRTVEEHTLGLEQKVSERTRQLQETNTQLGEANGQLAEAHKKLRDSIDYAKLLQDSILPRDTAPGLVDLALIWQPKDIVSGDFYATRPLPDGSLLLGLFDCTGHGVPGAFMTMTLNTALSAVLEATPDADPATLLSRLHRRVRAALQQESRGEIDNGLDAALCHLTPGAPSLRFGGARIGLFVATAEGISEVKPDRHGVGYARLGEGKPYATQSVPIPPGATFYLTSDGLLDDPGEASGQPLGKKGLFALIAAVQTLPVAAQAAAIEEAFRTHRGALAQRVDIAVMIFRRR